MNEECSRTITFAQVTKQQKPPSQKQISQMIDQFDWDSRFGPQSGITREQRYERAIKYDLNPPAEIKNYLNTKPHPLDQFSKLC